MKKNFARIINIIFIVCFGWLLLHLFSYPISLAYSVSPLISFSSACIFLIIFIFIFNFLKTKTGIISRKKEILIVLFFFLLLFFIQLFLSYQLRVEPMWDFGIVYNQAKSYVLTGSRETLNTMFQYFQLHPHNSFLFFIEVFVMKFALLFHITDFLTLFLVFNIIVINLSIFILYLTVRKLFSVKTALFVLIFCLFISPLFLYSPIFYSDTMALLFPILLVYLSTFFDFKTKLFWKNSLLLGLFVFVLFIGFSIKTTVLLIGVCVLGWVLSKLSFKKCVIFVLLSGSLFVSFHVLYKTILYKNPKYQIVTNRYGALPYNLWILMGIEDPNDSNYKYLRQTYGGYSTADFQRTAGFKNKEEARVWNRKEIRRRLNSYKPIDYIHYLTKKAVNAWGDGTYYSVMKLELGYIEPDTTFFHQLFLKDGDNFYWYLYFAQGVQFVILFLMFYGAIMALVKGDRTLLCCRFGVLVLFVFLLIWENRSRYLFHYLPIFILLSIHSFEYLYKTVSLYLEKRKNT